MLNDRLFRRSINIIKEYNSVTGNVFLTKADNFYGVTVIKYITPGIERCIKRGALDLLCAEEFFYVAVRYVNDEIAWAEPVRKFSCKYNPKYSRGCTDNNCPRALGGTDYRYIFGISCPFRRSPRAR